MSPSLKIISNSVDKTLDIGRKIAQSLCRGDIICLFGGLGSGKTQLVKGIACGLGAVRDNVSSPSFVLLKQYYGKATLNHFDLYRLKRIEEILKIGFDEYVYNDAISVIEWAERLEGCLPKEFLKIGLSIVDKNTREFRFSARGKRYKAILKALGAIKKR